MCVSKEEWSTLKGTIRREGGAERSVLLQVLRDHRAHAHERDRREGEPLDGVSQVRPIVHCGLHKAHGSDGWKALEEADIVAAIDKLYAAQSPEGKAKIDAAANGRIEADRIAREAKKGLTLDLGDI